MTAGCCSHLLLSAGRAAIHQYLPAVGPTAANLLQRQPNDGADRRTPDSFIDPALHTMQAVSVTALYD